MIKNTKVIAVGDGWITPGSKGVVIAVPKAGHTSVMVRWDEIKPPTSEYKGHVPNKGEKLYHILSNLILAEECKDPNILFKMRRS